MTHASATRALKTVSVLTMVFGILMVLALFTPLTAALNVFLDLAHFPVDSGQSLDTDTEALLTAISGGLLCGLGALVWLITEHVYSRDPALGFRILVTGLLAWYIPDSLGSLAAGAWFNVVMNSAFLALFLVPLVRASRPAPQPQI